MSILAFAALMIGLPVHAQVIPQNTTIEGRLYDGANPLGAGESSYPVDFKLQVLVEGTSCVVYSEEHLAVDVAGSATGAGFYALALGSGTSASAPLSSFARAFSNSEVVSSISGCSAVTLSNQARVVHIAVHKPTDAPGSYTDLNPDTVITSVPTALIAESAQKLGGKASTDFVQIKDDGTTDLNQANVETVFSTANYARLIELLSATGVTMGNQRITNLANPTAAQDAATKNYTDSNLAGHTIDLNGVALGFGGGKVLTWDSANEKWVATDPAIAGTAGGDLAGSYPNPTIAALAVGTSKLANDAVTSAKINSAGIATNRLLTTDATTGATVTYANCGNDEILKYVMGTGWQCATVDSLSPVTKVAGKTGIVTLNAADIGGLGTAAVRDIGTAATEVPELDAGGRLNVSTIPIFAGDVTGSIGANGVARLQGRDVADVNPNLNEVLRWNGTRWEPQALTDNVGITALTGDISAAGSGSQVAVLTNGVVTTPKMFTNPGRSRLVATDDVSGAALKPFECAADETLQWDGTPGAGWKCVNVANMLGSSYLTDGGNTRGAAVTMGTNDNFALNFETNNTARMTIDASGNVGIGTTSASAKLTVAGSLAAVAGASTAGQFTISGAGDAYNYSGMTFANTQNGSKWSLRHRNGSTFSGEANSLFFEYFDGATYSNPLTISKDGFIGIGLTSPNRYLTVAGGARFAPAPLPATPAAGDLVFDAAASNALKFYNGSAWQTVGTGNGSGDFKANGSVAMTGNLKLNNHWLSGDGGNEGLYVDSAGNVGIGTTSPGSLFTIDDPGTGNTVFGVNPGISQFNNSLEIQRFSGATAYASTGTANAPNGFGLTLRSEAGLDGEAAMTFYEVQNTAGTIQYGYIGATSTASNSSPALVFGNKSGPAAYAERMRIAANGNVGIGTVSPTQLLDVNGPMHLKPSALPTGSAGDLAIESGSNALRYHNGTTWASVGAGDFFANGTSAMTGALRLKGNTSLPTLSFQTDTTTGIFSSAVGTLSLGTAGTERLKIDSSGNVGIGISAARLLHVGGIARLKPTTLDTGAAGDIAIESGANQLKYHNGTSWVTVGSGTGDFMRDGSVAMSGNIKLAGNYLSYNGGSDGLQVKSDGNVVVVGYLGIGKTSPTNALDINGGLTASDRIWGATGSVSGPAFSFSSDPDTGIFSPSNDTVAFGTGGNERVRITNGGKVGIGTSNPDRLLSVNGPIRIAAGNLPSSPLAGDLAFDSNAGNTLKFHNGTSWVSVGKGDFMADGSVAMTGNLRLNDNWLSGDGGNEGLFVDSNGKVGIGTSPSAKLDVSGKFRASDNYTGTTSYDIHETTANYAPASSPGSAVFVSGMQNTMNINGSTGMSNVRADGLSTTVYYNGSGGLYQMLGHNIEVDSFTSAPVTSAGGIYSRVVTGASGSINNATGIQSVVQASSGSMGTAKGMHIQVVESGSTISQAYGLYIDTINGTNKYALFQSDASAPNYLAGNVGIGISLAKAKLDVSGQVRSIGPGGTSMTNTTTNIDWDKGNAQEMTVDCAATTFTNMLDGGTYTLAVTDSGASTCVFSQGGLTFYYYPGNGPRNPTSRTVYTFQRINSSVYVSWVTGFQ